jgi:hypothetical protein
MKAITPEPSVCKTITHEISVFRKPLTPWPTVVPRKTPSPELVLRKTLTPERVFAPIENIAKEM